MIECWNFQDARRCSYLGELDSIEEESEETSDEFEFSHEIVAGGGGVVVTGEEKDLADTGDDPGRTGTSSKHPSASFMKKWNAMSRQQLLDRLLHVSRMNSGLGSDRRNGSALSGYKVQQVDEVPAGGNGAPAPADGIADAEGAVNEEEEEEEANVGSEILDGDDEMEDVYDLHDHGAFDQVEEGKVPTLTLFQKVESSCLFYSHSA